MPHGLSHRTPPQTVLHQIYHELFGLFIYCVVLVVIIALFAPTAKRYRRLGHVEQANRLTTQMFILIGVTAIIGVPLIAMLH